MRKYFKTIDELIEEENQFIKCIPNQLGINLLSVEGIEYEQQEDGQLLSIKIIFKPLSSNNSEYQEEMMINKLN